MNVNGQQRPVDDFAPRANLKRLFRDGAISSGDSEKVKEAASRYFVEEKHVLGYIRHLEELQVVSAIREEDRNKKRAADNNKAYKDYDWENITTSGKLATLKVKELEKYLKEHNLSFMGKKEDKVKRIRSDFYINRSANTDPEDDVSGSSEDETSSVESTSDSDEDDVLRVIPDSDTEENTVASGSDDSGDEALHLVTTRRNRAGSFPHSRYQDFYVY
jgi:hypothetical protein